ncbi:MAG: DNRLRE domain-containing protein [Clostridium sp.]
MQVLQLYSLASTSISSVNPNINNRCNDLLKVGNVRSERYNYIKTETLISFDFSCINYSSMGVKKVFLTLFVPEWKSIACKEEYDFILNVNKEPFDENWVNWQTKPKSSYYKIEAISKESLDSGGVNIDITDLVEGWIDGSIENYGITIETKEVDTIIAIAPGCNQFGPKLTFYCECQKCNCSNNKVNAIELQVKNRKMEITTNKGVVKYDSTINLIGTALSYDSNSSYIELKEAGVYMAQWWIAIDGSGNVSEISFAIGYENGDINSPSSAPVFVLSQFFGQSLIEVTSVPVRVGVINVSGEDIQFANVTTQAGLIITKL